MKRKFVAGLAGLTVVMAPALASAQARYGSGSASSSLALCGTAAMAGAASQAGAQPGCVLPAGDAVPVAGVQPAPLVPVATPGGANVGLGLLIALDVVLASFAAYKILDSLRDNGRPRSA